MRDIKFDGQCIFLPYEYIKTQKELASKNTILELKKRVARGRRTTSSRAKMVRIYRVIKKSNERN